VSFNLCL